MRIDSQGKLVMIENLRAIVAAIDNAKDLEGMRLRVTQFQQQSKGSFAKSYWTWNWFSERV